MKLVFSTPANVSGGAERVITTLANFCAKNGHEVIYINFDSDSNFYELNGKVKIIKLDLNIKGKGIIKLFSVLRIEVLRFVKIRKILKSEKPDCVIAFLKIAEIFFGINSINLKIPFITSIRNQYSSYSGILVLFRKIFYPHSKYIVCQTEQVKRELDKEIKCNSIVIPNPINNDAVSIREEKDRCKKIIAVGRLCEQKNYALMLDAFSEIHKKKPEYILEIYGTGEDYNKIKSRIIELELQDTVYLRGVCKNPLASNNDAVLYIMTSNYEGFPNTLVEAMANGIPVISSDFTTGAASDLIGKNNLRGLLFEVNNKEALVDAVMYALDNPLEMNEKADRALEYVQCFKEEVIASKWLEIIELSSNYKK